MSKLYYFSVDSSDQLKNTYLQAHDCNLFGRICLSDFLLDDHPRRTILVFETVDCLDQSTLNIKGKPLSPVVSKDISVFQDAMINLDIDMLSFSYPIDAQNIDLELNVFALLETPLIGLGDVTPEQSQVINSSKILSIYIIFSKKKHTSLSPLFDYQMYESYSHLGFFMGDLDLIDAYIRSKDNPVNNNLLEAFTTTELAEELFNEGLLILCWGITPWVYFIQSPYLSQQVYDTPLGEPTEVHGYYRLQEKIRRVSIVPGHALKNWELCLAQTWPTLMIDGEGESIDLSLSVIKANNKMDQPVPIPIFFVERTNDQNKVSPLLSLDLFEIMDSI